MHKILISRLSAHGDIIQTLPLLNTLRTLYPDAVIGWLVEPAGAPLLNDHPQLNYVHELPLKALKKHLLAGQWRTAYSLWKTVYTSIKQVQYTVSLDPQGLLKSALLPWLLSIPKRVGFDQTREQAAWLYTHRLPPHHMKNPDKRTVDWFNGLANGIAAVESLPEPAYVLPPVLPVHLHAVQQAFQRLPRPIIVLAPGTIWPSKQWPHWPALFAKLANQSVVLVGSPAEQAQVDSWLATTFSHGLPSTWQNWTGQTDWPMLQALLSQVDVVIGPDSAPLHLANAVANGLNQGRQPRLIGLFGPTAPGRTGPVGEHHTTVQTALPCQPCFKRRCPLTGEHVHACLKQVSPEMVLHLLTPFLIAFKQGMTE
jgi:heptosyltransferase I